MKFIVGQKIQCDYCKESFVFDDTRNLEIDIKAGGIKNYLLCPKCKQKIFSDDTMVIVGNLKNNYEPKTEFEANLQADVGPYDNLF